MDFEGTSALVTGGASGIGFGLATALVERGAGAVVLADVEEPALAEATDRLAAAASARVMGLVCDVADPQAVLAMVEAARDAVGPLQVACLNAGVFTGGYSWEATDDDWDWVMSTNVRGVVNGIRAVVPDMVAAGLPAQVLITASLAGLVSSPVSAPYVTSKFAALGLAESLHHDLMLAQATHVKASVLCPAMVSTNIGDCERNRPADLPDRTDTEGTAMSAIGIEDAMARGLDPLVGARHALDQVAEGRFYVSTHPVELWERLVGNQNEDRLAGRAPRFQMLE